ncbi:MAG: histidine kinase [Proteobacteria bacterium]|nr:histidine kinase [Pseudomonadota bacterium]
MDGTLQPAPADGQVSLLTLVDTIEQLSAARTFQDVAAVVRVSARRISGADGVSIVLRDEDRCHYVDEDAISPLWKGKKFPMSACISGWAMLNKQTAIIPDIYADPRIPHDAYRPTFVKSLVMTPVSRADPIAAIGAYWAVKREPPREVVERLEVIARATATALANVTLINSLAESLERRDALNRELDHRVKNTLATVQSIAAQTLTRSNDTVEFTQAFTGRLKSLARAHELLAREDWTDADLGDLIELALEPFLPMGDQRVRLNGPPLRVKPESAVTVLMTFHELATNAAKYGALSSPSGKVSISWSVMDGLFELIWRESGGPPVSQPVRRGFGSRLIEKGAARDLGGEALLTFRPSGVTLRLIAPLSHRLALP